jgi:F0F1-type ATP synthase assembly protein I
MAKNLTKKGIESIREAGPYLGLGFQLAATILFMLYIGYLLDNYFDIYPVLMLVFAFFGAFAGIYNFIKTVININEKKKVEKNS